MSTASCNLSTWIFAMHFKYINKNHVREKEKQYFKQKIKRLWRKRCCYYSLAKAMRGKESTDCYSRDWQALSQTLMECSLPQTSWSIYICIQALKLQKSSLFFLRTKYLFFTPKPAEKNNSSQLVTHVVSAMVLARTQEQAVKTTLNLRALFRDGS